VLTEIQGVPNTQDQYSATSSTKARELCIRFCSQLSLTHKVTSISEELADKMSSIGALAGRSPLSAAAACIYFASHLMKEPKTAKEISLVAGVSDGTIRTAYKLLEAEKDMLVNPDWLKDGKGDMGLLPKV
jgi:transcription initiation factor TFIIB